MINGLKVVEAGGLGNILITRIFLYNFIEKLELYVKFLNHPTKISEISLIVNNYVIS